MESDLGTEVRGSGAEVLLYGPAHSPNNVLSRAILAGHERAYRRFGYVPNIGTANFRVPTKSGGEVHGPKEERSLIPCMTAIIIKMMKMGGFHRTYKQKAKHGGAE